MLSIRGSLLVAMFLGLSACTSLDAGDVMPISMQNTGVDAAISIPAPMGPDAAVVSVDVGADAGMASPMDAGKTPAECKEGEDKCDGKVPLHCSAGGTWERGAECPYVCKVGQCIGECTPKDLSCAPDGKTVRICQVDGAWQPGETCVGVCTAGKCSGSCSPLALQCSGTDLQECTSSGTWAVKTPCPNACVNGACSGECKASSVSCAQGIPQTCNAMGRWLPSAPCTTNTCVDGRCAGECIQGARRCLMNSFVEQLCSARGTWDPQPIRQGVCAAQCTPGAAGVLCYPGTKRAATCNADGSLIQGSAASACGAECKPMDTQCSFLTKLPQLCTADGVWVTDSGSTRVCN
ncbi:MAG: hypothetical protein RL385_757 [Pseudomonadota bacterium]|jgi:hypothetical protein